MKKIEFDVLYKVSDWVSAALAYKKSVDDQKPFIIIAWILVAYVFASYLTPGLFSLLCVPFKTCSAELFWKMLKVAVIGFGGCALVLVIAYSNILYRLRIEFTFRMSFVRFKQEYQEPCKIIASDEGVSIEKQTHKTTIYWKSFQQVIESRDAFLLSTRKYHYLLIPKSAFRNLDHMTRFNEMVMTNTGQQMKYVDR